MSGVVGYEGQISDLVEYHFFMYYEVIKKDPAILFQKKLLPTKKTIILVKKLFKKYFAARIKYLVQKVAIIKLF